jgi:hypothetical protein
MFSTSRIHHWFLLAVAENLGIGILFLIMYNYIQNFLESIEIIQK